MKKIFYSCFIATILLSCSQANDEVTPEVKDPTEVATVDFSKQTLLLQGDFKGSSQHPSTSGKAKVYKDAANVLTLVLEDLKVDNGPDLRIYLAEDAAITNFVEIAAIVKNGTNNYKIPSTVNLDKQKVVSVWCKQFAVSFGNSAMTKP